MAGLEKKVAIDKGASNPQPTHLQGREDMSGGNSN